MSNYPAMNAASHPLLTATLIEDLTEDTPLAGFSAAMTNIMFWPMGTESPKIHATVCFFGIPALYFTEIMWYK
jgi:hypothetical protein